MTPLRGSEHVQAQPFDLSTIGRGLVFAESLDALAAALDAAGSAAVVQAPPGTGKTTLVPPLLANLGAVEGGSIRGGERPGRIVVTQPRRVVVTQPRRIVVTQPRRVVVTQPRRVVVTQPRRVAARAAARRLTFLDGSRLGERVGHTVRGECTAGPGTMVEFVTPGILLRRLLGDPALPGVATVILDEVHERGLETDLLVGMLAEVRELRGDLRLVAMSATVDAHRFAALLGDDGAPATVVDCPAALHPLEVRWAPAPGPRLDERGVTRKFLVHVADTAGAVHARALAADSSVDALVFVPGAREVADVAARLRATTDPGIEVLELHGQVDAASQDRAVSGREPGGPPRIVVSTALAESSLTVPGVRLVVDSGLAREPRRDSVRGMSGLVTVSASRASADQRAGRAARLGPGTVVRCYDQRTYAAAPAHAMPEIAVADLTGAALVLACWGAPGGRGLALPDPPPPRALADAVEVLRDLGAVDDDGLASPLGRTLARVPADPRLARALLDGSDAVGMRTAAEVVALVAGDWRAPDADLGRLLAELRSGRDPGTRRWREEVHRLEGIARVELGRPEGSRGKGGRRGRGSRSVETSGGVVDALGYVVALAYPDRVARRVLGGSSYLLASGTAAGLPAGSPLAGHEWLAVAEVTRAAGRNAAGTGAVIRSAAALDGESAAKAAAQLLTDRVEARFEGGRVLARRERRLGAITLSSTPVRPAREEGRAAVARALAEGGLGVIGWSTAADALRRRLAVVRRELGEPWPDVSEAALLARLEEWLGPELGALSAGELVRGVDLAEPLRRLLPWPEASRLGELVPERLEVPSGSRVRIEYPAVAADGEARPVVAVKLQECFGWAETPRLVDGRVPVVFHLLSPAGRPLAVTDDLASFWSGPYAQVRAEMRGRYPKHPWPEDPWTAPATARTNRRG
ncbi:MAG: ATP-dependent helicase HrpB [Actinomycetota bacterium]